MNRYEQKNSQLVTEFDRYILENPDFADTIPQGALVALQIEGDNAFNQWSRKTAQAQAEPGQQVIFIRIKKIRPLRSRIDELEVMK